MGEPMRFLVLYGWAGDYDLAKHPDVLVSLIENIGIAPNKIAVSLPGEKKPRNRTVYKNSSLIDVAAPFTSYNWIALDEPIEGNFLNVRSHLAFDLGDKTYLVAKLSNDSSVAEILRHIQLLCEYITPLYGFSHIERGAAALFFPFGIASTSLPSEVRRRVLDLGQSYRVTHEHINGKMHDVYELNVLSPAHLEWPIRSKPLRDWIAAGDRGHLIEVKKDVVAWIVPDDLRATVRSALFKEGALIATV